MRPSANIIKKIRRNLLMEQTEFGHFLGVSKQAVSLYERGLRMPKLGIISKMRDLAKAKGIEVCIDDFFREKR